MAKQETRLAVKVGDGTADDKDWKKYFTDKNSELETEYSSLLYGTKTKVGNGYRKVGYEKLRDFFDGDQWQYMPEGGQSTKVYNHVRGTVINYTAFMTNEPIDIDVPAEDITDQEDVARAEGKEKLLKDVLEDNGFNSLLEEAVQNGSLLGDSIITGPFYDDDKERIYIQNIKRPENVRIIWADESFTEIFGYIHHYFVSPEKAYKMFPKAKEKGIIFDTIEINSSVSSVSSENTARGASAGGSRLRMTEVMDCWTEDQHVLLVGNQLLDSEGNEMGFIPMYHVRNMPHPIDSHGVSDVEDMLDAQVELNEKNSDMSEIISESAFPWIFGKNLDPAEVRAGAMNLIDVGDEAEIIPDPRRGNPSTLDAELNRRQSTIFQLTGLNENIFGGQGVRAVTGRALSVLMQTVNNRIKGRQQRWTTALQKMFENIFRLIELKSPEAKELIGGSYRTDIFFPGTLLRNITDEINKFNAKLQSQETTMKNLGVPSPKDEKKLMKEELNDKMMMVELSRNPQLQLQIHQMLNQRIAQEVAGQNPTLREDQNEEELPSATGGAPQQSGGSPEGAIAEAAQQSGANVNLETEE